MFEILTTPCAALDPTMARALGELASDAFDRFDLVRETSWSQPDRSIRAEVGGVVACFYYLVMRTVRVDDRPVRVAGLHNLVTVPDFRRQGIGSALLARTESTWFDELGAELGLLLCADALLPFYSNLGWQRVDARLVYAQPDGKREWIANTMVLAPDRGRVDATTIDLSGLPW